METIKRPFLKKYEDFINQLESNWLEGKSPSVDGQTCQVLKNQIKEIEKSNNKSYIFLNTRLFLAKMDCLYDPKKGKK